MPRKYTLTHVELQDQTTELLGFLGWRFLHVRKSIGRRSGGRGWQTTTNLSGWPDLAPCWSARQPGRIVAIELKVPPDKPTDDQARILAELDAAGWEAYVVTERDLPLLAATLAVGGMRHPSSGSGLPLDPSPSPAKKGSAR